MKHSLILITTLALIISSACTPSNKTYQPEYGEGKYILTPEVGPKPVIHGPNVFGVRPGSPFQYTIPATGKMPLSYLVNNLPDGLIFNENTGIINGKIASQEMKDYTVVLKVKNELGQAEKSLIIKVGKQICLTPPLGWNSWNCWGKEVTQERVLASARAMVNKGLKNYGWTYINIDDAWQGSRGGKYNAIQGNPLTFPDMKAMCDEAHELGLKIGIYSTPWITSYAGFIGGSSDSKDGKWSAAVNAEEFKKANMIHGTYKFDENDARQWANWGIDYLKYDWNPNDPDATRRMARALRNCGRDIVYSLSNSAPLKYAKIFGSEVHCFRTAGDLKDRWNQEGPHLNIRQQWLRHKYWLEIGVQGGPGHFPDPDMLVVGHVSTSGKDGNPVPSSLTADEQYSHISLWSLWSAPMLIGAPIEMLDDFTMNLLTNSEVLAMHQDEKAIPARSVLCSANEEVFVKELADGSIAVGLFNLKDETSIVTISWDLLGLQGAQSVRDIWRQENIGTWDNQFSANVQPHGVVLVKISNIHK